MPACSNGTVSNVLPHRNACADTGHDTPSRHSIQTRGRPVAVLSIDVEHHTGIHNYLFLSWVRPDRVKTIKIICSQRVLVMGVEGAEDICDYAAI